METSHEYYMQHAIHQAKIGFKNKEVPIGAVILHKETIIAKSYNMVEVLKDATAHAEMLAMSSAFQYFGHKYLNNCVMYTTLEPCCMCAGAAYWAQLGGVVFGAADAVRGGCTYPRNLLHATTKVTPGVLSIQCEDLINDFFSNLRRRKV